MSLESELRERRKKRLEEGVENSVDFNSDIAPIDVTKPVVAPVNKEAAAAAQQSLDKYKAENAQKIAEEKESKWFEAGAFSDGFSLKNAVKTYIGTGTDVVKNITERGFEALEHAIDSGAYGLGVVGSVFGEKGQEFQDKVADWIAKDQIKGEGVADWLITNTTPAGLIGKALDVDSETDSLLGDKSDAMVQNVAHMVGTKMLEKVGVPSFVVTGLDSFGAEVENAYQNGATDFQAGLSGTISAGAEIIFEKLSGGIKFKSLGGTWDDWITDWISRKLSNGIARTLLKFGIDVVGEGAEEYFTEVTSDIGRKLTYMDEKEWKEILAGEDKWDAFVMGAVMGAGGSVVSGVSNKVQGKDPVTELKGNEEAVVKKYYEDSVAKAEAEGKKLSLKEKNKLWEEAVSKLKNGQISIETIEEVLGGESYKNYKDAVDSDSAIMKEMESLRDEYLELNKSVLTGEQTDRKAEIQKKLAELKTKYEQSNQKELKAKLNNEVYELSKGTKLENSYIETAKKGEAFKADLSKYKDKSVQATVKRAMESGVLNDTQRTHEFVEFVAALEKHSGIPFDFVNNVNLKDAGLLVEGATVNGVVSNGRVSLNVDSNKMLETTVGHEIMHFLENGDKEAYKKIKKMLFDMAKKKGEFKSRRDALRQLYKTADGETISSELAADLVGDYLFSDPDFIKNLLTEDKNLFHKVWREIKDLIKIVTPGTKEAKRLEKVEREFKKVFDEFKASGETVEDTKYSVSKNAKKSIDNSSDYGYNRTYGWVTTNNIINAGQRADFDSKFAGIVANGDSAHRTDTGEYMIPVSDMYDAKKDGIQDTIIFASGTIDNPVISSVIKIDADNETELTEARREIYEAERRGIRQKTTGIFRRYNSSDYGRSRVEQSELRQGKGYNNQFRTYGRRSGKKTKKSVSYRITDEGHKQYNLRPYKKASSKDGVFSNAKKTKYSLSADTEGRALSPVTANRFANSKAVDENGNLKVLYHGTASGEFSIFDKAKGSVEGDFGSGFYFTDNEYDVSEHYEGGGPDFENKVDRRAEQIAFDEDIDYDEAKKKAREELYKGSHKFEVYLNIENPAVVGETVLLDSDSYYSEYDINEYENEDDYYGDVEQLVADDIDNIIWDVESNTDVNSTDGIAEVLWEAFNEGGIGIEQLKTKINNLYLEDSNGNLLGNEVTRQVIESLGYDGIIDPTVSGKWNMDIEPGTSHYIVFKPNQIKAVTNQNPTDNPDIHLSLSDKNQAKSQTPATELRYEGKDISPLRGNPVGATETVKTNKNTTPKQKPVESKIEGFTEDYAPITEADAEAMRSESFGSLSDADVPSGEYAPVANAPVKQTSAKRTKRVDAEEAHRGGEKERSWYETSTTSEAVNNMVTPDDIPNDVRYYQVKSNKKTLAVANAKLEKDGYTKSKEYFKNRMSDKKLSVEDIALGERLIQEAAKSGDAEGLRELIVDVSVIGTELGQKVQALSLIRRLSPEGQLLAVTRTVERGQKRGDKSFEGVEITDDMSKRITDVVKPDGTYDQAELNAAVEDVKQQIADQMSVSLREYLNGWRYLSMLGNPKTHIRNVVSNAAMFGTRAVKNAIARSAEDIFLKNRKTVLNTDDIGPVAQTPMRQVLAEGTKVKAADRNNIGTVRSFDSKTGKYTVYFKSPNGKTATVELDSNLVKPLYSETSNTATTSNNGESGPVHARTKTWKRATDVVKDFAKKTTTEMEVEITDGAKYSDEASIKAKRKIFKTKAGNFINDINSTSLEMEDAFFSRSTFKLTFQEYLTANGITTEADIKNNPELIEKAKDYALEEAKRATFRQDSYIANKISEIENKNAALGVAIGSIMPFKKTPINVAKTGLAYSPLGFARNVYDFVQVKKGNMDITEAIDHVGQTLTGTSLSLIGFALASAGVLNGAGEDDKEGQYDYQLGEQAYSFNFNGNSYSLSWLSPVAMPLFVGANAYEQFVEKEDLDMNIITDALGQTFDPLSEMSFLSGLDDVLSSYESGMGKFFGAAGSMVQNYATQFIPTASSQLAATLDDTKRSTKASKDSGWAFGEETFNKIKYKIPLLRNTLEPSTDIWGNEVEQSDNFFVRGFESFLNPANKREIITSDVDVEIKDLYGETGDSSVVPSIPYNYLNYNGKKYEMSSKEFTEYKKTYGQTAYDLLDDLFETETYKNATSEERADMVKRVYDYARDEAKREYFKGVDLEYTNATKDGVEYYKENAIKEAIAHDMTAEEYEFYSEKPAKHAVAKSVGGYKAYKAYQSALSKITSDKNASGSTVSGSRKKKVIQYINGLDISFGEKLILFKNEYPADNTYNQQIIQYLKDNDDISSAEMKQILVGLGFTVTDNGKIYWD